MPYWFIWCTELERRFRLFSKHVTVQCIDYCSELRMSSNRVSGIGERTSKTNWYNADLYLDLIVGLQRHMFMSKQHILEVRYLSVNVMRPNAPNRGVLFLVHR